jgi:hypothetical protein
MIEGRLAEDSDMDIISQKIPEVKCSQYTPGIDGIIDLMDFEKCILASPEGTTFSDRSHNPIST